MRLILALLLLPSLAHAQAFRLGQGAQMTCQSTAPSAGQSRGIIWCKSTDSNALYYTTPAGVSAAVGGGGGAGDMILGSVQTNTANKTFNTGTLIAASPVFSGTSTGTYTLGGTPTLAGTLSLAADTITIKNTAVAARGAIKSESVIAGSFTVEGNSTYTGFFDHNFNGFKIVSQLVTVRSAGSGDFYEFNGVGAFPTADGTITSGAASHRHSYGFFGSSSAAITCDSTTRGAMRVLFSGSGVADVLQACMKQAAGDTYAFRTVFTAP